MDLLIKSSKETGEAREGNYAQRVVEGYEKDGSPKYRYFKTLEDYKTYIENKNKPGGKSDKDKRGGTKKQGKDLKEKVEREQNDAKKEAKISASRQKNLFLKDNKNDQTTKKSLRLFVPLVEEN